MEERVRYLTGELALTEAEVKKLLSVITDLRDAVLIRLAISTGIRREDIVAIETKNIIENEQDRVFKITFWEEKKNRWWTVYVGGETYQMLKMYLNSFKKMPKYLFPKNDKKLDVHITGRTAYNILNKYLKMAGLEKRPFHALRATAIKLMKQRGYTIEEVMKVTGDTWKTISMHYAVPSDSELKDTVKNKPVL